MGRSEEEVSPDSMNKIEFKAVVVANEINLGKIAPHFGIMRKFRWEDSLILKEKDLTGILKAPDGKQAFIFHFGSIVFVNCQHHESMDILQYIKHLDKSIQTAQINDFTDDYCIEVSSEKEEVLSNDFMIVKAFDETFHPEIIATILAKSAALEKIEAAIDGLLDEVEDIVAYLNQGRLTASDEQLAKLSARVLGFKFNTISYIMLLDKPDITWVNPAAESVFNKMSTLFELQDRYEKIRHKSETLLDITQVFTGLAHAKRGTRLEWAIIILIMIEIMLSLYDMFLRH